MDPSRIRGSIGWIRFSDRAKPGHADVDLETQNRRFSFVKFIPELEAKNCGFASGPASYNFRITFESVDTNAISICKIKGFTMAVRRRIRVGSASELRRIRFSGRAKLGHMGADVEIPNRRFSFVI